MSPPTANEINPYDDLDGRMACEHFLGKTVEEAEELLKDSPLVYEEDLMWMGVAAFRYYFPAVFRFVERSTGAEICDFVGHLISTLESRLEHDAEQLRPIAGQLTGFCEYVLQHWSIFEEGTAAYGDVRTRFEALFRAFSRLNEGNKQ